LVLRNRKNEILIISQNSRIMFVTSKEGATDFPKTVLNVYKNTDSLEPEDHNAFWLPIDLSNIFFITLRID